MPNQRSKDKAHYSCYMPTGRAHGLITRADREGTNGTAIVNALVAWWLGEPGAELPTRPGDQHPEATVRSA